MTTTAADLHAAETTERLQAGLQEFAAECPLDGPIGAHIELQVH